jgi:hypothetical protein
MEDVQCLFLPGKNPPFDRRKRHCPPAHLILILLLVLIIGKVGNENENNGEDEKKNSCSSASIRG